MPKISLFASNLRNKISSHHVLSLAGNVISVISGLGIYAMLAHKLPTRADFGCWIFFSVTLALVEIVRTGFLQNSVVRFYSGASLKRALNIAGSAWFIGIVITGIVCLANLIVYAWWYRGTGNTDMDILINWLGITFISTLPFSVALWIMQAKNRFDIVLWIKSINQLSFFVVILILMCVDKLTLNSVVIANLLTNVIASLAAIVMGWAQLKAIRHRSTECIKEMWHYGKYSVSTTVSANLLRSSDTYMIKLIMGAASAEAIGLYNLPQKLMEGIETPLRSVTSTVMPLLSAAAKKKDNAQVAYLMKKYASILSLALLPICVAGFIGAGLIIDIVGGQKFSNSESVVIWRIFMCYAVLLPADRFLGITLDMINKPHVNMVKVFIMLGVNVIGDAVGLIMFHSIIVVAVVSILTFTAGVLYGYICLKKYLQFTMLDIFAFGYNEIKAIINKNRKQTVYNGE